MCGINGIVNFHNSSSIDKSLLKGMNRAIRYRGPDDEGYYIDDNCGLAHARLSIIDLSKKGKQPMSNEDSSVMIVFNGEIYNFKELRPALEKKGHKFRSNTDTEAIVHGYEEYGESVVRYLRGMFAFAIWDSKNKKLFLARDRIGKKPLFYYKDKEKLIFSSELKSILLDESIKKEVCIEALSHYLTYGYVPAPLSIFKNIKKLMPGHILAADVEGNVKTKEYWDLKYNPVNKPEDYYCKRILEGIEEATKTRLISDVPLGAFLSGGIDSSAVVAMMSKFSDKVKTFTISFEESSFDETGDARIISERFNTDHKEFVVKADAAKVLPRLIWHYNEPFADPSALPSYYVAKMTSKHVKVALNGDGGDESFAGYGRFFIDKYADRYKKLPPLIKKTAAYFVRRPAFGMAQLNIIKRLDELGRISGMSKDERYIELLSLLNQPEKNRICTKSSGILDHDSRKIFLDCMKKMHKDALSRKLYAGVKIYLSNDLNVKMDIATMANSLEARSPFLDHNIMEFAATIPSGIKMKNNEKKYILKKALGKILPKRIINKKKQGFSVPLNSWFRGDLRELSYNVLLDKRTAERGYFRGKEIKRLLEQHKRRRGENGYKIWLLLWLELWNRIYIDNGKKKPEFNLNKLV